MKIPACVRIIRSVLFCTLIAMGFFLVSNSAYAWKPSTHVYLVKRAIDEAYFDNQLQKWLVPVYKTKYADQEKTEVIGNFEVDTNIINILKNPSNKSALHAGIVGPDGYPDMPTGQTRIHVACPDGAERLDAGESCPAPDHSEVNSQPLHLISDDWLQYIWDEAQNENDEIKAFAFGYLTHAAGDMFMHTFVNYFAGGPFSSFSDNGLRHFILESYVGKRTPSLTNADYEISLSNNLSQFIYEKLVDASPASKLHRDLLVELPFSYMAQPQNVHNTVSFPRFFSSLKNQLNNNINNYEQQISKLDSQLEQLNSELDDCIERGLDAQPFNECAVDKILGLSLAIGGTTLSKDALLYGFGLIVEFTRTWINNIDNGLKAWPAFSHEVVKYMIFSKNGLDQEKLTEAWESYRNDYFLEMLGAPGFIGDALNELNKLKNSIQIYGKSYPEWQEELEDIKSDIYDLILQTITNNPELTFDDIKEYHTRPHRYLDTVLGQDGITRPGNNPHKITVAEVNQKLKLNDPYYPDSMDEIDADWERFDDDRFAPAFNTKTMIKLMLLNKSGRDALYRKLACDDPDNCTLEAPIADNSDAANVMLGFIRTLDGGNEWKNHMEKMPFAECKVYQQIFMLQDGEENETNADCIRIENIDDQALEQLNPPTITPTDTTFNSPFEVILSHTQSDVQIYYTISEVEVPHLPSNDPENSFSRFYAGPFIQYAPFDRVRPLVLRAIAYKTGFRASDIATLQFTIDATQNTPTFFPELIDHLGTVNVTINHDPGSSVYYTLNGSTPDYTSTLYTGSLSLGVGQYDIRAIAYRIGYPPSAIASKQYNVWSGNGDNMEMPRFTPGGSADVTSEIEISIASENQNAEIYYTVVESSVYQEPTKSDIKYNGPFKLNIGDWFIAAKAFDRTGQLGPSVENRINITVWEPVGNTDLPVITPNGGIFNNPVSISISGETTPDNAGTPQVFYTTDGSEPYASPIKSGQNKTPKLFKNTTLKVQALQKFFNPSPVASARFDFYAANPEFDHPTGEYEDQVEVSLSSITEFAKIYYTLGGNEPDQENGVLFNINNPVVITETTMIKAKAFKNGFYDSETTVATYQIKHKVAPEITLQPNSTTAYESQSIILKSDAGGYPLPIYQWYKDGQAIPDKTQKTLRLENLELNDSGTYQVEVSNDVGNRFSDDATINILALPELPTINQQPQSQTLNIGDTLMLSVAITSVGDTSYLWYHNDQPLLEQNASILQIGNINSFHAGKYKVLVKNLAGITVSDEAEATVLNIDSTTSHSESDAAPEIVLQPQSISVNEGEAISLAVVVKAIPQASYIWMQEQKLLSDQQSDNLLIQNATQANAGNYRVIIRNVLGVAVSDEVTVQVNSISSKENSQPTENDSDNTQQQTVEAKNKSRSSGGLNPIFILVFFLLAVHFRTRKRGKRDPESGKPVFIKNSRWI